MARFITSIECAVLARLPNQSAAIHIGCLFLMTVTLAAPTLIFSVPEAAALSKDPMRVCHCSCQYKRGNKWVRGLSGIGFSSPQDTKCESYNRDPTFCKRGAADGGGSVEGRLSDCSIVGLTDESAGGVPEGGGVLDPGAQTGRPQDAEQATGGVDPGPRQPDNGQMNLQQNWQLLTPNQ